MSPFPPILREQIWDAFSVEACVNDLCAQSVLDVNLKTVRKLNDRIMSLYVRVRQGQEIKTEEEMYIHTVLLCQTEELFCRMCDMNRLLGLTPPIPVMLEEENLYRDLCLLEKNVSRHASVFCPIETVRSRSMSSESLSSQRHKLYEMREKVQHLRCHTPNPSNQELIWFESCEEQLAYIECRLQDVMATPPIVDELRERVTRLYKLDENKRIKRRLTSEAQILLREERQKIHRISSHLFQRFLQEECDRIESTS